jgi:hypothetical protein
MPTKTFDAVTGECRVRFRLPAEAGAEQAWLVGDFNGWSTDATPLVRQPDGSLEVEVVLPPGRDYRFRYYRGGDRWDNDWSADAYEPNDFGGADSIVSVPPHPGGHGPTAVVSVAPLRRPRPGQGRPDQSRPSQAPSLTTKPKPTPGPAPEVTRG